MLRKLIKYEKKFQYFPEKKNADQNWKHKKFSDIAEDVI